MATITITTGLSTTLKSAQSKKCRMLKKVRDGLMHPNVAFAIRIADPLLSSIMSEADIENAIAGNKPARSGGSGSVQITVEI